MSQATAFKEWSLICDALGAGRQSLILRKGGIHEGRQGFQFDHPQFYLFPTRFHQQAEHIRPGELDAAASVPGEEFEVGEPVEIRFRADLQAKWTVSDWSKIASLEPFHIWDETTVRERFECALSDGDPPALNVALVRVYRFAEPWVFPYERGHGGCRSWVEIPAPPGEAEAVLADDAAEQRRREIEALLK